MRFHSVSPLRIALSLAVAASLFAAAPASAAGPTLRTASLDGGHVQASVAGTYRTGAWKLVIGRPGSPERLRVFIERGDVFWGGKVVAQRFIDGRWVTMRRERLDHDGRLAHTLCASELGACVTGGTVLAPHPGAQRLAATFRLNGHGTWSLTGSVREQSEPFILGPWLPDTVESLTF
jgi:hypothetical protein